MAIASQYIPAAYSLTAVGVWGTSDFLGGVGARRANAFLFTAIVHVSGMLLVGAIALMTHAAFPGLVSVGWAGYSLITGKGYYKGCPPGGWDRSEHPFNYWAPTLIILAIGICMLLVFFGVIPLPSRQLSH